MKRLILLSLCISASAAVAVAGSVEIHAQYRIRMADGSVVLARDLPRTNGSVTTFHASGSGALTGVPSEDVVRIETSVTPRRFPPMGVAAAEATDDAVRPLEPGEAIDLGPMGDPGSATAPGRKSAAATAVSANAYPPVDMRILGGGGAPAAGLLPNGQPANQAPAGDVLRAQSANVPTMGLDTQTQTSTIGFPATVSSQTALVNADGTPNIGPNGFPGTPQAVIGQNGFPGTSGQPAIGPNGFPGTAQTTIDANGFPTAATAGVTTTDVNGFPASATPATGIGNVLVAPNGAVTSVAPPVSQTGAGAFVQAPQAAAQPKAGRAAAPAPHR